MTSQTEQFDQIRRLAGDGKNINEIAVETRLAVGTVRNYAHRAHIAIPPLPPEEIGDEPITVTLGKVSVDRYRAQAAYRGVDARTLMAKLLATIANDDLFTAILDI